MIAKPNRRRSGSGIFGARAGSGPARWLRSAGFAARSAGAGKAHAARADGFVPSRGVARSERGCWVRPVPVRGPGRWVRCLLGGRARWWVRFLPRRGPDSWYRRDPGWRPGGGNGRLRRAPGPAAGPLGLFSPGGPPRKPTGPDGRAAARMGSLAPGRGGRWSDLGVGGVRSRGARGSVSRAAEWRRPTDKIEGTRPFEQGNRAGGISARAAPCRSTVTPTPIAPGRGAQGRLPGRGDSRYNPNRIASFPERRTP